MASETEPCELPKNIADTNSGVAKKIFNWDKIIKVREDELKALKEKESRLKEQRDNEVSRIQLLQDDMQKFEAEEQERLESEGISLKLQALQDEIERYKSDFRVRLSVFPKCLECGELCNPSQDRLVYACKEGHNICGPCADSISKCPTCQWDKAEIGGRFFRVRWYENISDKLIRYEENDESFENFCRLKFEELVVVARKREVSKEFEEKKAPLLKKMEEATQALDACKEDLRRTLDEQSCVRQGKDYFLNILDKDASQIEEIVNFVDASQQPLSRIANYLHCSCQLACPHPLLIGNDEKIVGNPCGCVKEGPCLCVTHSITMDLSIERGSSGSIKVHLAGRSNPKAVNRFLKAVNENHFAGLIIDQLRKDWFIGGGYFTVDGARKNLVLSPDEQVVDLSDPHRLECRPFSFGYCEVANLGRTTFHIYLDNNPHENLRTIGEVIDGLDLINEINNLPKSSKNLGGVDFLLLPQQVVTIGSSKGQVSDAKHQLYSAQQA